MYLLICAAVFLIAYLINATIITVFHHRDLLIPSPASSARRLVHD